MKTSQLLIPLVLWLPTAQPVEQPSKDATKVEVKVVKHEAFADAIKAQQGKVVLVYCWANYEPVSKVGFPRLLKLQEKYADKAVTIVTASLDPKAEERTKKVERFLAQARTTFPNYILDGEAEFWRKKLKINTEPAIVIFDRKGNLAAALDLTQNDSGPPDSLFHKAEAIVSKLLAEKAP